MMLVFVIMIIMIIEVAELRRIWKNIYYKLNMFCLHRYMQQKPYWKLETLKSKWLLSIHSKVFSYFVYDLKNSKTIKYRSLKISNFSDKQVYLIKVTEILIKLACRGKQQWPGQIILMRILVALICSIYLLYILGKYVKSIEE